MDRPRSAWCTEWRSSPPGHRAGNDGSTPRPSSAPGRSRTISPVRPCRGTTPGATDGEAELERACLPTGQAGILSCLDSGAGVVPGRHRDRPTVPNSARVIWSTKNGHVARNSIPIPRVRRRITSAFRTVGPTFARTHSLGAFPGFVVADRPYVVLCGGLALGAGATRKRRSLPAGATRPRSGHDHPGGASRRFFLHHSPILRHS